MISLARNPLDWIRSSIVQDIEGYFPVLKSLLNKQNIETTDDQDIIVKGLAHIITTMTLILNREGGVDACLERMPNNADAVFENSSFAADMDSRRIFHMILRPFNWFEKHFQKALNVHPSQMKKVGGLHEFADQTTNYVVIRYEDLEQALPAYLKSNGMEKFQLEPSELRELGWNDIAIDYYGFPNRDWTFGGALKRARAALAAEVGT